MLRQPNTNNKSINLENLFVESAHAQFRNSHPEYVESLVELKTYSVNEDTNSAEGAFTIREPRSGKVYQVPCILTDGQIKPFIMAYYEEKDEFFPFTKEWISQKFTGVAEYGALHSMKDVSLPPSGVKGVASPPISNRKVVYASEGIFLDAVSEDNSLKEALKNTLDEDPDILKKLAEKFSKEDLEKALSKNDDVKVDEERSTKVFKSSTPLEDFVESVDAARIQEEIALRGFTIRQQGEFKEAERIYDVHEKMASAEKEGWHSLEGGEKGYHIPDLQIFLLEGGRYIDSDGIPSMPTQKEAALNSMAPEDLQHGEKSIILSKNSVMGPFEVLSRYKAPDEELILFTDKGKVAFSNSLEDGTMVKLANTTVLGSNCLAVQALPEDKSKFTHRNEKEDSIKVSYSVRNNGWSIDSSAPLSKEAAALDLCNRGYEWRSTIKALDDAIEKDVHIRPLDTFEKKAEEKNERPLNFKLDLSVIKLANEVATPEMDELGLIGSLSDLVDLPMVLQQSIPKVEQGLSNLGKILHSLWTKETLLLDEIGIVTYSSLNKKTMTIFKALGDLILRLKKSQLDKVIEDGLEAG